MVPLLELLDFSSDSDSEEESNVSNLCLSAIVHPRRWRKQCLEDREMYSEFRLFYRLDDADFKNYYRLGRAQFHEIHEIVGPEIEGVENNANPPLPTMLKLAVCLRFLATGDTFRTIGRSYYIGEQTVSKIVKQVCSSLWKTLQPIYMPKPTVEDWAKYATEFETKWHFHNCCGAIDGKHVVIKKPSRAGSSYINYKGTHSVVLMATVDADYRFTVIDVGSMGRFSDSNVFNRSSFGRELYSGTLELPAPKPLPGQSELTPFVFVADEAFPLLINLMRPYPGSQLNNNIRKIFNYRLSSARQTVECTFGILASRFRVYRRPFECKTSLVDDIVKATCVLHNYLRNGIIGKPHNVVADIQKNPMPVHQLRPLAGNRTRSSKESFNIRENFAAFFVSPAAMAIGVSTTRKILDLSDFYEPMFLRN